MKKRLVSFCLFFLVVICTAAAGAKSIPHPSGAFVNDYAYIISTSFLDEMATVQKEAFKTYDTPIIVVTINSMAEYGGGTSIEEFTRRWFDKWQIGKLGSSGKTINRGILLLVSVRDRKARIELGADWGNNWDAYCDSVMQTAIIPYFKQENYNRGIVEAVRALGEMAKKGPQSEPISSSSLSQWLESQDPPICTSLFSGNIIILMVAIGVLLIMGSFLVPPQYRSTMVWAGIGLIVLAVLTWVVLIVLAIFARGRRIFSSGGGFGSGGFSGGGGASGSW